MLQVLNKVPLKAIFNSLFFSCDQALRTVQSICPSVLSVCLSVHLSICLSVCYTFFTMFPSSYHHEIFRSYYHWQTWCLFKRSRSEVKGQGHRGKKIVKFDPDWPFPDCSIKEVLYCFSRSYIKLQGHTAKTIVNFDCNSSLNSPMATKWCTKLKVAWKRCPIAFQGQISPKLGVSGL